MPNNPEGNERPPLHYEDGIPVFDSEAERINRQNQIKEDREDAYKREQLSIQRTTLNTQIILVIFGMVGAVIGGIQAHIGKVAADASITAATAAANSSRTATDTLNEMKNGSGATDTHTLAQQAVTQATQTTALAKATSDQAGFTSDLASASKVQAEAGNKLASVTQQQLLYSQRPWIGMETGEAPFRLVKDSPIEVHVGLRNYGNSPALHLRVHVETMVISSSPFSWETMVTRIENLDFLKERETTIFNGQILPLPGSLTKPVSTELLRQIENEEVFIVFQGAVQYSDEFDSPHKTTFCIRYIKHHDERPAAWVGCPLKTLAS